MRRSVGILKICAVIVVWFGVSIESPAYAEVNRRGSLELLLMVDLDRFAEDEFAPFRKLLLDEAERLGATESISLKPGESTLNQLVSRTYGYADKRGAAPFRQVQAEIVSSIIKLNNVDPTKLRPGQTFLVPQFIRRPLTRGSSPAIAQVLNASNRKRYLASYDSVTEQSWSYTIAAPSTTSNAALWSRDAVLSDEAVLSTTTQRRAATTLIGVDADQLEEVGGIPWLRSKIRDGAFSLLPDTTHYIINFNQTPIARSLSKVSADEYPEATKSPFKLNPEQLRKVTQAGPGKLYLLDVFSSTEGCKHGDLVYDKAVQTLKSLGLANEVGRIQKISVDFYADRARNTQLIKDWIDRSFRGNALKNYNQALSALMNSPSPSGVALDSVEVPGLFLQALYGMLSEDPSTLVVSGSFYTLAADAVFPKEIILHEHASLVSAVLNEASAIEARTHYNKEPLSTFNLYRELIGTVLVGYFDRDGVPRGMYSEKGFGVTTIDDGVVLGTMGGCTGLQTQGASFAAPVVATKLLVGRLLWASEANVPNAIAARNRLVGSADVNRAYLGKYWSAGASSPAKLYASVGNYLVTPEGSTSDAALMSGRLTVTVEIPSVFGATLAEYIFDPDPTDSSRGFTALLLDGESAFMLEKQLSQPPVWRERRINGICFCVNETTVVPISEAKKLIKEVRRHE